MSGKKRNNPKRRNKKSASGFTMVEVVVASALLIVGVTVLFSAVITSIRTQHTASNLYHATCLARNRIQRGLSLPFNTLPVLEESNSFVDQDGNSTTDGPFRRTTILTELTSNCYKVKVNVFYPTGGGRVSEKPVTIESKISRGMHSEEIEE